ncbi:hypothetical protein RB195_017690 [Necator americanus]|uniref:Secreted protein n=1 Tax=Necator americanus TaxID=51031 RepID=A0ABR1C6B8_NECAM
MVHSAFVLLVFTLCIFVHGTLEPPPIDNQVLLNKMKKTGMIPKKTQDFVKIFSNNNTGIYKQQNAAKTFIASLKNPKVKKETQKVFDELKNAQDFAWMALNKTEEVLVPLSGLPVTQIQNQLDKTCEEAKGNLSKCLPTAFRVIALQAAHQSGKNKTAQLDPNNMATRRSKQSS